MKWRPANGAGVVFTFDKGLSGGGVMSRGRYCA